MQDETTDHQEVREFNPREIQLEIDKVLARFSKGEMYGQWVLTMAGIDEDGIDYNVVSTSVGLRPWQAWGLLEEARRSFDNASPLTFTDPNRLCPDPREEEYYDFEDYDDEGDYDDE